MRESLIQEYVGNARVMHAILDDKARRLADKVFARHRDETITYGTLSDKSARIATFLVDRLKVERG